MATLGRAGSIALNGGGPSGVPASERSPPLTEGESTECCGNPSLPGKVGLALRDPRNFLKRVPSLDEFESWFCAGDNCPEAADGERTGNASTLVEAETSFGPEICLSSTRFR